MNNEQQALEILRKIAEGDASRPLFLNASEDARRVESELRRLQGEVKRLEQESVGDAPCGHPARLFAEQLGEKFCVYCEWEKTNTAYVGALSRFNRAEAKLKNEIFQRDAAERDALRLRRKVKKLKRKLKSAACRRVVSCADVAELLPGVFY